jgi:hypothetical protein
VMHTASALQFYDEALSNRARHCPSAGVHMAVGCGTSAHTTKPVHMENCDVLGPVPGVGVVVMAKRPQGWVKCEGRLSYCKDSSCSSPLATTPRPRLSALHDSRGPRRGRGRPGSRARSSGALVASMQHEGAVPDSCVQNEMRRASHLWTK